MAHDDTIMTPKEVAELLKIDPRHLSRLDIPRLKLGHKTIRYFRKDVIAWLKKQNG